MIGDDEEFFRRLRDIGAGPKTLAAVRKGLRSLAPPYPEPEIVAAVDARAIRQANRLLAACLRQADDKES
jgi:hypothetical protein